MLCVIVPGDSVGSTSCSTNMGIFFFNMGSGGGASDIRIGGTSLSNRVLVAAGGGGGGISGSPSGGAGGGTVGGMFHFLISK